MSQNAKAELRRNILAARPQSSAGLTERLLELTAQLAAARIASYQPLPSEPDVGDFNRHMSKATQLFFPRISKDRLVFASGPLKPGSFEIIEPQGPATSELDLILLPALAADLMGNRLGKGKGFYDKSLGGFAETKKYAVVFDSEVFDEIPHDPWDVKMDGIVTPSRIIKLS